MKKVQEFVKFTNPLILNVIRGFYLSNDRDLCHSSFSCDMSWQGITTEVQLGVVAKLANITDEQLVEIEAEIDLVVNQNKIIQTENKTIIDDAVQVLKSLNNGLLSKYLDKNVDLPRPDYTRWYRYEFVVPGTVRRYVESAKIAIETYHKKLKAVEDKKVLTGEAVEYLISIGKRCGLDFNFENALNLANDYAGQREFERIMSLNPDVDYSDAEWEPHYGHSFKSVDIYITGIDD